MIATIILVILQFMGLALYISKHGESKKDVEYNVFHKIVFMIIIFTLYSYAGLFDKLNL